MFSILFSILIQVKPSHTFPLDKYEKKSSKIYRFLKMLNELPCERIYKLQHIEKC